MRQLCVRVDAGQLVDAAEQIDGIDGPVLDLLALLRRCADHLPALESAAGDEHGEHAAEVVAPAVPGRLPVDLRRAAELAAAPDQRALQEAAGGEIREQRREPLVQLRALAPHRREMVRVRVPAAGVVDRDVGHARLDHAARGEAVLPERVAAVAVAQLRVLLRQVEHLAPRAEDQVVGLLLRLGGQREQRVAVDRVGHRVELVQQLAPRRLPLVGHAARDDALDLEPHPVRVAARREGLELRAEEAGLGEAPLRLREHDVRRDQPLVAGLVALEVGEHGADARIREALARDVAGLHQVRGGLVAVVLVGHAADQRELVRDLRKLREQLAHLHAGHARLDRAGELARVVVARVGLGIPRVGVRHAAPQEDLDD